MTNRVRRIEFPEKTRALIAQRAGYRCSFPGCDKTTIGPGKDISKSLCIGIAAHIYSAATSGLGPRGAGGLTTEELKSAENGIWLCSIHSNLIDKHSGDEYPAPTLHSYKSLHEARISYELSGVHTPFGWVDHINIRSSPLLAEPSKIELAKVTLLTGGNSTGKTALCEWLMASANAKYLERWRRLDTGRNALCVDVVYHNPDRHVISVSFKSEEWPHYELDGDPTAIPCGPIKFMYPKDIEFPRGEEYDDLELVSKALGLHQYDVLALCRDMSSSDFGFVTRAWFQYDDDVRHMYARVKHAKSNRRSHNILLRLLSDSERVRVLAELGMHAANRYSMVAPTLLILDSGFWRLDTEWLKRYVEILISPSCAFQTIASIGPRKAKYIDWKWAGWRVLRFDGIPPNVRVETNIRREEE